MRYIIAMLLMISPVVAQEMDQETKVWLLKRAYELNDNSMVGRGIDLTGVMPPKPVVAERFVPDGGYNAIDAAASKPKPVSDVCTRHKMHKVYHGSSWKCRR